MPPIFGDTGLASRAFLPPTPQSITGMSMTINSTIDDSMIAHSKRNHRLLLSSPRPSPGDTASLIQLLHLRHLARRARESKCPLIVVGERQDGLSPKRVKLKLALTHNRTRMDSTLFVDRQDSRQKAMSIHACCKSDRESENCYDVWRNVDRWALDDVVYARVTRDFHRGHRVGHDVCAEQEQNKRTNRALCATYRARVSSL